MEENEHNYLTLDKITPYIRAFNLSNYVWSNIIEWDYFAKRTVGVQFARAIDSISANIAEGFGRYTKKEKIMYYRIGIGSLKESIDWTEKSIVRGLINNEAGEYIKSELEQINKMIFSLINYTNEKLKI